MKTAVEIDAMAAAWIARRDAADGSAEVEQQLQEWIAADVRHRAAYLRHNAAWDRLRVVERLRAFDGPIDPYLLAPKRPARWWRHAARLASAASLAAGMTATGWLAWRLLASDVYVTGVGSFERVQLEDGSSIELNTDSKVRVRIDGSRRRVSLERGEAHFRVARDPHRPFVVEGGGSEVRAVGTAFTVRLRDVSKAEVLVTEGRVVVAASGKDAREATPETPLVVAGEVATVASTKLTVAAITSDTMARRLAWTEGKLVFDQETLAEAVAEFNRYNKTQLVVVDAAAAGIRVGGTFDATDVGSFLAALERIFGVRAEHSEARTIRLVSASPASVSPISAPIGALR
jgi:transmembrane sensor